MTPEKVNEMLRDYKENKGRCEHLAVMISVAEREVGQLRNDLVDAAAYHVQQYGNMDMPRGTDVGNPTEKAAMRLAADGSSKEIGEKLAEITAMQDEYEQKSTVLKFVGAWLSGLNEKDRWLITQQVIEGKYWREIVIGWSREFGEPLSKEWVRKRKMRALEKIYTMAS